jgi:hypothetical protein
MPSFMNTFRRWWSTVRGLRNSCAATSLLVAPFRHQSGDVKLLWGELGECARFALPGRLPGRPELRPRSVFPWDGAETLENLAGGPQPGPRLDSPSLAAKVLAEKELRSGSAERPRITLVEG